MQATHRPGLEMEMLLSIARFTAGTRLRLGKVSLAIATAIAVTMSIFTAVHAPPASAASYYPIICHGLIGSGLDGQLCIGRNDSNTHQMYGSFYQDNIYNESIYNNGYFVYDPSYQTALNCGYTTTKDKGTNYCYVTFKAGYPKVRVCIDYRYRGKWYGFCSNPAIPS